MRNFVIGVVVGIIGVGAIAIALLSLGAMPMYAVKAHPLPLERFFAGMALRTAIGDAVSLPSPVDASEINLISGAKIYRSQCAVCHGIPGQEVTAIARGMFPRPPFLMPPKKGVTDDPTGEIYWKAKYGIRLTGMPGFDGVLSDTELWEVSEFLHNANQIPTAALELLQHQ